MSDASPQDSLRIDVEDHGEAAVIRLVGSATMDVSADLQEELIGLVDRPMKQIVLDLSELEFVSSVGLGAIIAAHLRCRHHNCVVKLVTPPPKIRELLEVTRLTRLFDICDSVAEALAAPNT